MSGQDKTERNWNVYVLRCTLFPEGYIPKQGERVYYTGMTNDLLGRLGDHNNGRNPSTKGRQWSNVGVITGLTKMEARAVETFLKSLDWSERLRAVTHDRFGQRVYRRNCFDFFAEYHVELSNHITRWLREWSDVRDEIVHNGKALAL